MANFRGFKIVTFSTREQKGSQELNLNLIGVNRNKTLYLKPFVIPGEKEYSNRSRFLYCVDKVSMCLAQGPTLNRKPVKCLREWRSKVPKSSV